MARRASAVAVSRNPSGKVLKSQLKEAELKEEEP